MIVTLTVYNMNQGAVFLSLGLVNGKKVFANEEMDSENMSLPFTYFKLCELCGLQ